MNQLFHRYGKPLPATDRTEPTPEYLATCTPELQAWIASGKAPAVAKYLARVEVFARQMAGLPELPTALDDPITRRLRLLTASVGADYADCTLANYDTPRDDQAAALRSLHEYLADLAGHISAGDGIVLFGPVGTGKDHLLVGCAKEAINAGHLVTYRYGPELFGECSSAASKGKSWDAVVQAMIRAEILILSDPVVSGDNRTSWLETLTQIYDGRMRERRPTWTALNVSNGEDAAKLFGAPLYDRMRHKALRIHTNWPSGRKPL